MARIQNRKPVHSPRRNRGPLWLALAGVGLLLIAAWAVWSSRQVNQGPELSGPPRLAVETTLIDYGSVRLGTPIHTEIKITNTGGEALVFKEKPYIEVREGC